MSQVVENLLSVRAALPSGVELVAVSKFHPIEKLREAYDAGQRIFGESRVQELQGKHESLPADIEWHFIGHLQTNKVKYIAPYISLIHAVDSYNLLAEISRQGQRAGRLIPCLLQLHIAQEETKFGFTPDECLSMLEQGQWKTLNGARIDGIMCMASNTDDGEQIRQEFLLAQHTFQTIRERHFADQPMFRICSWGMSDDFPIAIQCGANMVRVGSKIFGQREM